MPAAESHEQENARKSSRIASGSRPRSYRERDLLPSIARPKQKKEKKLRQGTRRSSRASTSTHTKYTDWDTDEEDDSDAYVPRWRGGSASGQQNSNGGTADEDEDDEDANSSRGSRTFDLSGRPLLRKLPNPAPPLLPTSGGDEIHEERMPLPAREDMVEGKGRGALIFEEEFSQFRPNVTPEEMLREGAFGGTAFR